MPLSWTEMSLTRSSCSKVHPTWTWTLPMRHIKLLWTTSQSSVSSPSLQSIPFLCPTLFHLKLLPLSYHYRPYHKVFLTGPLKVLKNSSRGLYSRDIFSPGWTTPTPSVWLNSRGVPSCLTSSEPAPADSCPSYIGCCRIGLNTPGRVSPEQNGGAELPLQPAGHTAFDTAQNTVGFIGLQVHIARPYAIIVIIGNVQQRMFLP